MGEACGNIMKPKLYWKRGAILLQTLVMSVLLSLMAVMVLKWVLARYMVANRMQASAKNTGSAQGYASSNVNTWTVPSNNSTIMDGKPVTFIRITSGGTRFETTVTDAY